MMKRVLFFNLLLTASLSAKPVITSIGNMYSWLSPVSPGFGIAQGSIFGIKGRDLGPAAYPSLHPAPVAGNDQGVTVQVTVGGTTVVAPTYYAWNQQVAAVLPSGAPVGTGTLTVSYYGSTSDPSPITVVQNAFGILTMDSSGTGTAKVCDYNFGDGQCTTFPSLANSAKPGDVITLWGAGLGPTLNDATGVNLTTAVPVQVWIGGQPATVTYAARSQFAGLDLINTSIPASVIPGCYVTIAVQIGNNISNFASLPMAPDGGACTDSATGLTGNSLDSITRKSSFTLAEVDLSHTLMPPVNPYAPGSGGDLTSESANAVFYRLNPIQYRNLPQYFPQASPGSCTVWTFADDGHGRLVGVDPPTQLDAGSITITSGGVTDTMQFFPNTLTYYMSAVSPGFYAGDAAVRGAGGTDIGSFQASTNAFSGFTWVNRAAVNLVGRAAGQSITWRNAAPGSTVEIFGSSNSFAPSAQSGFACRAPADTGSFTIPSWVLLALRPSQSFQPGETGSILSVINRGKPVPFTAAGLDQGLLTFAITSTQSVFYQ